ncbi:MAG: Ig-like domain-containing protein [Pseudomonadota bacterium]
MSTTLFTVDEGGVLVSIDPETGIGTAVSTIGVDDPGSLAAFAAPAAAPPTVGISFIGFSSVVDEGEDVIIGIESDDPTTEVTVEIQLLGPAAFGVNLPSTDAADFDLSAFTPIPNAPGDFGFTTEVTFTGSTFIDLQSVINADDTTANEAFAVVLAEPSDGSYLVDPQDDAVFLFLGDQGDGDIPAVGFDGLAQLADEGDANNIRMVPLQRTGDLSAALSVEVDVQPAGIDGAEADDIVGGFGPRTVTFAAGSATATLEIEVVGDTAFEADDFLTLSLIPDPSFTITQATFGVGIDDDDNVAPVATDIDLTGTFATEVEENTLTTLFIADIIGFFGSDANGMLDASSLSFNGATLGGQAFTLDQVGFTYAPDGDDGTIVLDTSLLPFTSLTADVETVLALDFEVSDGELTDTGTLSLLVTNNPESNEFFGVPEDVLIIQNLNFLGPVPADQPVNAQATAAAGGITSTLSFGAGVTFISYFLDDFIPDDLVDQNAVPDNDDPSLLDLPPEAVDLDALEGFQFVATVAANGATATASLTGDGFAGAIALDGGNAEARATNQSFANAAAFGPMSTASATAEDNSVAGSGAESGSEATASASGQSSASAVAIEGTDATATAESQKSAAATPSNLSGVAGQPIDLSGLVDVGASGLGGHGQAIVVSGLPEGSEIGGQTAGADGIVTLSGDQVDDLTLIVPVAFQGAFELTVGALLPAGASDDVAEAIATQTLAISPAVGNPNVNVNVVSETVEEQPVTQVSVARTVAQVLSLPDDCGEIQLTLNLDGTVDVVLVLEDGATLSADDVAGLLALAEIDLTLGDPLPAGATPVPITADASSIDASGPVGAPATQNIQGTPAESFEEEVAFSIPPGASLIGDAATLAAFADLGFFAVGPQITFPDGFDGAVPGIDNANVANLIATGASPAFDIEVTVTLTTTTTTPVTALSVTDNAVVGDLTVNEALAFLLDAGLSNLAEALESSKTLDDPPPSGTLTVTTNQEATAAQDITEDTDVRIVGQVLTLPDDCGTIFLTLNENGSTDVTLVLEHGAPLAGLASDTLGDLAFGAFMNGPPVPLPFALDFDTVDPSDPTVATAIQTFIMDDTVTTTQALSISIAAGTTILPTSPDAFLPFVPGTFAGPASDGTFTAPSNALLSGTDDADLAALFDALQAAEIVSGTIDVTEDLTTATVTDVFRLTTIDQVQFDDASVDEALTLLAAAGLTDLADALEEAKEPDDPPVEGTLTVTTTEEDRSEIVSSFEVVDIRFVGQVLELPAGCGTIFLTLNEDGSTSVQLLLEDGTLLPAEAAGILGDLDPGGDGVPDQAPPVPLPSFDITTVTPQTAQLPLSGTSFNEVESAFTNENLTIEIAAGTTVLPVDPADLLPFVPGTFTGPAADGSFTAPADATIFSGSNTELFEALQSADILTGTVEVTQAIENITLLRSVNIIAVDEVLFDAVTVQDAIVLLDDAGLGGLADALEASKLPDPVDEPPQTTDDTATTKVGVPIIIDVLANDQDPEGADLTLVSVDDPANGTAEIVAGEIRYTPNPEFTGTETFGYTVADGGLTSEASVEVTVSTALTLVIDFEQFSAGDFVEGIDLSDGVPGGAVTVVATGTAAQPGAGGALIFDSVNPTGDDSDLAFDDPARGNVLIVSQEGDSTDPNDAAAGGTFTFAFEAPVDVLSLDAIDIEEGGLVRAFGAAGQQIAALQLPTGADGEAVEIDLGLSDVSRLEVQLFGSGALDDLTYRLACPDGGHGTSQIFEATAAVETYALSSGPDRVVFDQLSDSTRGAQDVVQGFGVEDEIDLSALGFDRIVTEGQPGDGALLMREIGVGKPWYATLLTAGWGQDDFDLRVLGSLDPAQVVLSVESDPGDGTQSADDPPGDPLGPTIVATGAQEVHRSTDLAERFVFPTLSSSTRAAQDRIEGFDPGDTVDLSGLGFDGFVFDGQPGQGKLLVRELGAGTPWEATMFTSGWGDDAFDFRIAGHGIDLTRIVFDDSASGPPPDTGDGPVDGPAPDLPGSDEMLFTATPEKEVLQATEAPDRFVYSDAVQSTRAKQDVLQGLDADDTVDLTALGFDELVFSGQPGDGKLLVRTVGVGTTWEATLLTAGWQEDAFDLRIRVADFDASQVLV